VTASRSAAEVAAPPGGLWQRLWAYLRLHVRYEVIAILFLVMTINQADRATLSIAGVPMAGELGLSKVELGWLLSSFAWAYMIFQVPGGWAIDRFGSIRTFGTAIFAWSIFAGLAAFVTLFGHGSAVPLIFALIFLVGVAAAPSFPSNSKIVAMWFPANERATATAIFNSSQYFAAAVFTPLLAVIGAHLGWRAIFGFMGVIGVAAGLVFRRRVKTPRDTVQLTETELQHIREGGALVDRGPRPPAPAAGGHTQGYYLRKLLTNRMLLGIYIGQYGISTLTFFFLTWFPIYLVEARHVSLLQAGIMASVPAIFGLIGGLCGGAFSDMLLRRGASLSWARKLPLCLGMLLSSSIIVCNYVNSDGLILVFMALAFFGKAMGALGWAIVSDVSPPHQAGLNASIFNTFSSAAGITTPIAIGYLVQHTHSFNAALVFVGAHALLAIACFVFVVGPIRRVELD